MTEGVRTRAPERFPERLRRYADELTSLVTRSNRHRERLDAIDTRISVSGTRGKTTMARWLHDELVERDIDTYAKLTGSEPVSIYNGREWAIPRSGRTTLYENEREIARFAPMEALVVENQGITPYTTRLVNSRYVDPNIVVLTNVREDHLDTLGGNRERICRALTRSVPEGTHVVCGEQSQALEQYIARELEQRDATVTFVDVPPAYERIPGAELVFCLDETLRRTTGSGLDSARAERYLDSLRVSWEQLPGGRVFDAAAANDIQSTEAVRRSLVGETGEVIQPLVYLRRDRPGRTASFVRYLNLLADQGHVEQARIVDGHAAAVEARTDLPVVTHSPSETPDSVLETALADGWPVILMGNATPEFMQELRAEVARRSSSAAELPPGAAIDRSLEWATADGGQVLVLDRSETERTGHVCTDLLTAGYPDRVLIASTDDTAAEALEPLLGPDSSDAPTVEHGHGGATALARGLVDKCTTEGEPGGTSVCFDAVTGLIEEQGLPSAFRILHVVTNALEQNGVTAHYHLSADAHDEETIGTLDPLFDTIITINSAGERRVHTREADDRPAP